MMHIGLAIGVIAGSRLIGALCMIFGIVLMGWLLPPCTQRVETRNALRHGI